MMISSDFDGGNIECLSCDQAEDIRLSIRTDANSHFYQWFYFRLTGARGRNCTLKITNAGGAAYTKGWVGYRAVASHDRRNWFRVDTDFDGEVLTIRHQPTKDSIYFAYFAPYSMERHADFLARLCESPLVALSVPGQTLDGQDVDVLRVAAEGVIGGDEPASGYLTAWIVGRQHPGETMAEWWMEGFLDRLLDPADAVARDVLNKAVFYVVPNMNPDGSRRGHLRTNAAGANLNREWSTPSLERSPEVYVVREMMRRTGVDFCLDVHGDEALPYNFIAGTLGIPSLSKSQAELLRRYRQALVTASPDFQVEHGYPENAPGAANLTYCSNYVAETFKCLAMTLEMPFKDAADTPNPDTGWSPARCRELGAANIDALAQVIDDLG